MESKGYYIPEVTGLTFNPKAAEAYWKYFSERLLPIDIDGCGLMQLSPRMMICKQKINNETLPRIAFRNVYPLM